MHLTAYVKIDLTAFYAAHLNEPLDDFDLLTNLLIDLYCISIDCKVSGL